MSDAAKPTMDVEMVPDDVAVAGQEDNTGDEAIEPGSRLALARQEIIPEANPGSDGS